MSATPEKETPGAATSGGFEKLTNLEQKNGALITAGSQGGAGRTFTYTESGGEQLRPADYSAGDPANFPVDALPDNIRMIAEDLAATYQAPVCMAGMTALAVLSGSVGKSVVVRGAYKDKDTRLNLFVIAASERGTCKGNLGEKLAAPLKARSREISDAYRRECAELRAEMGVIRKRIEIKEKQNSKSAAAVNQADKDLITDHDRLSQLQHAASQARSLVTGDVTSQKLAILLACNGEATFSFSTEAGLIIQNLLGRYNDGKEDLDLYLSGYSGDSVTVDRITRQGVDLSSPCLSLFWAIQSNVLHRLCSSEEAFSRGFTARALIFETGARRQFDCRSERRFTHGGVWEALLKRVLDARAGVSADNPVVIECSPGAREQFARFHDESVRLENEVFPDLGGELSRLRENAIKVAGLIAVASRAQSVSEKVAVQAVRLVRWTAFNYLSILQSGRQERQKDELARLFVLLEQAGGEMHLGDLARHHGFKRERINAVIAACPGKLETIYRRQPAGKPGQPAQLLRRVPPRTESPESTQSPS